jgi:hypothetical protein
MTAEHIYKRQKGTRLLNQRTIIDDVLGDCREGRREETGELACLCGDQWRAKKGAGSIDPARELLAS